MGSSVSSSASGSRRPSSVAVGPSIPSPNTDPSSRSKKSDLDRINEERRRKESVALSVAKSVDPGEAEGEGPTMGKDVMISYSHADMDKMKKIRDILEDHGLSVWVDISGLTAGVNFLSKIGQAIIDCKAFISLLSENNLKSRCCKDELALAYISNKPIYPIGLQTPQELLPLMDTGMRLQLARFDWFVVTNPITFEDNMATFARDLRLSIPQEITINDETPSSDTTDATTSTSPEKPPSLQRRKTFTNKKEVQSTEEEQRATFWERHFDQHASWDEFEKTFSSEYSTQLKEVFGEQNIEWVLGLLKRELEVDQEDGKVTKDMYAAFCTVEGKEIPLWTRLTDQAIESYCTREVFNMDSSVRVQAIENMGHMRSKAVIEALLDLLEDKDNNVRTVAALSLAKTGENSSKVINKLLKCLESEDRLVRESGCLALGHLRAKKAVPKLIHLWRNDYISSVRDACQVALEQIGGEEANKAIHITNLLAQEIRTLTES